MPVEHLVADLYRLDLGRYQCYLWRGTDGVLLVDTGELDSVPALVAGLAEAGLGPGDLDGVVLTHFHDDHVGGAAALAAAGGAPIIAHAADAPVIRGDRTGPAPAFTEWERDLHARVSAGLKPAPAVRVDREVVDGDRLGIADAVVVAAPGHTDGSIAVHLPDAGVVFTGDIAAEYGGRVIPGVFNLDAAQVARSLDRLAGLDVDVACFGHGRPAIGGAQAALRAAADAADTG